ncbi:MAG: hypothetical protein U0599_24700 [Vicinamibacteria bacterium]
MSFAPWTRPPISGSTSTFTYSFSSVTACHVLSTLRSVSVSFWVYG